MKKTKTNPSVQKKASPPKKMLWLQMSFIMSAPITRKEMEATEEMIFKKTAKLCESAGILLRRIA